MTDPQYSPPSATPYAPAGVVPPEERTNVLAIVALVAAFVVPLAGIICGHIALSQIKRTGERGHGLALAGTVLGYAFVALGLLIAVIVVAVTFATGVTAYNR
jgi:Domain of unknown function (DUF4190)